MERSNKHRKYRIETDFARIAYLKDFGN